MVVSWKVNIIESIKLVLEGTSDMKVFFFYFDNSASRNKNAEEKIYELHAHLYRDAFQFYFDKFTRDGEMLNDAKDYTKVKAAFLKKYQRRKDPSTIMQDALQARLDINDLAVSLNKLEELLRKG